MDMYNRCRILGDFEAAGENCFFAVELAHLIGYHSTYEKFPVIAKTAEDPDTLYFRVLSRPDKDGSTFCREGNIVTMVPNGRGWELFRQLDLQYESVTGWKETPRKLDLPPAGIVPASDAPEYIYPRYKRTDKGLESLFAREFLLEDKDGNGLTDTERVRFAPGGIMTEKVWYAMCDLACRFGMETTDLCFPLVDPCYDGHTVFFKEGERSGIECRFCGSAARITVTLGEDSEAFMTELCERFPDTADEKTLLQLLHEMRPEAAKLSGTGLAHEEFTFTVPEVLYGPEGLRLQLKLTGPEGIREAAQALAAGSEPASAMLCRELAGYGLCTLRALDSSFPLPMPDPGTAEKDRCPEDLDLSEYAFSSPKERGALLDTLRRIPGISLFQAGETRKGLPIYAIRLLPRFEGYLSRTKLINKNPSALIISRSCEEDTGALRGQLLTLKTVLSDITYEKLAKEMNLVFLFLPKKDDPGTVRAVSKLFHRWLPDVILETKTAAETPRTYGYAAGEEAYSANRDLLTALKTHLGLSEPEEEAPMDCRALTHPWITAVSAVLEEQDADTLSEKTLRWIDLIRSTANVCEEERTETDTGRGLLRLVRTRPVIASGLYAERDCETEPFYK